MKINITKDELNNCGTLTLISYNPEPTIGKTPSDKSESIKVDIKNQPG